MYESFSLNITQETKRHRKRLKLKKKLNRDSKLEQIQNKNDQHRTRDNTSRIKNQRNVI